jgi:hypothetical protein
VATPDNQVTRVLHKRILQAFSKFCKVYLSRKIASKFIAYAGKETPTSVY